MYDLRKAYHCALYKLIHELPPRNWPIGAEKEGIFALRRLPLRAVTHGIPASLGKSYLPKAMEARIFGATLDLTLTHLVGPTTSRQEPSNLLEKSAALKISTRSSSFHRQCDPLDLEIRR
jgi:hypothetical protein